MAGAIVERIQSAVCVALQGAPRSVLAVSGGLDSMVLLHAAHSAGTSPSPIVATFDHGSGSHAAAAVDFVQSAALSLGLTVVVGRSKVVGQASEATWRDARLTFLAAVADEQRAIIFTAHTLDDQVETVLFRELRGAGARGLAGLEAASNMKRPLLRFTKQDLMDYAGAFGVEWMDDPTNVDLRYSRNRIRHEILPAIRVVHPRIDADLAAIGIAAARWRDELESWIDEHVRYETDANREVLQVDRDSLARSSPEGLAIIWPALLARIGVATDRRGTHRLVTFTNRGTTGQRVQLSGWWTVFKRRSVFEVRRDPPRRTGPRTV